MSLRETALRNAILRTARFDNILGFTESTPPRKVDAVKGNKYSIISNLTNSYYKIIISHDIIQEPRIKVVSIVEILNNKILSINAATSDEKYGILNNALIVTGIEGVLSISIEYYEDFKLSASVYNGTESINFRNSLIEYYVLTSDTEKVINKSYYEFVTFKKNDESFDSDTDYYVYNEEKNIYEKTIIDSFESDVDYYISVFNYVESKDSLLDSRKNYYEKRIKSTTHHHTQNVHSQDVYAKELNVATTKTNILDCREIKLGNWTILMTDPTQAVIS